MKFLLNDQRVDINKEDNDRETPFWIACEKEHIEIVKLLLNDERVININQANKFGYPPFGNACRKGRIEIVKLLLNDERVDVNWATYSQTPFSFACDKGHIEIVKLLLNDERVDINKANNYGQTPLYIACERGHIEVVGLLLNDKRIDINKANRYGQTPLFYVCQKGDIEIVKYILANGTRVTLAGKDNRGKTVSISNIIKNQIENERFQERKRNYGLIAELLESFERNPNETIAKLRVQLGFTGKNQFKLILFN